MIYEITYEGTGKKRHKVAHPIRNREELMKKRNSADNLNHLEKAHRGDDSEKRQLLQLAYNLGHVDGRLAGCKSIGSFFFYDVDCYDSEQSERIKSLILSKKEDIGLRMLERSASGGWHLVCRRKPGTTILENQVRTSCILQLEMDTSAHDLQRVVFSTSGSDDDLVYLDDELFTEPMSAEECETAYEKLKIREKRSQEEVPKGAKKSNKHYRPWEDNGAVRGEGITVMDTSQDEPSAEVKADAQPLDTPASVSSRVRFIADGVMKEKGLLPSDFTEAGGRHTSVKMLLSGATQLLRKDEMNAVLRELMPDHWRDQNIQQLVSDFYQNYTNPSQRLLKYQEQLFTQSRRLTGDTQESADSPSSRTMIYQPPKMPRKLPKLIALITRNTPDIYVPAVAHALFPPLATHLCDVHFTYTDNVEHEATLMCCLMAGTGTGKGCIDEPISHIMADIRQRDKVNEDREKEWKKSNRKRGEGKGELARPEGLVIQIIDADMTKPALVTRLEEAEGHFVYVKLNELDLFEQLKGQTGKQHFQLMCLAFDPGSEYGQTRVGTQSVTARPRCRFNWNACTTIQKGRRFFSRVLTDGPISRINFCTIPDAEIGGDQPVYGQYDFAYDEALKPYIDNLVAARGHIDCPQATRLARQLQQECAEVARLSQNEVYWNLSHRACVIAWLKACVLYVANGMKWERAMDDFIRWSLNYDLYCKMAFFGEDIERANSGDSARLGTRGPRNLLELLPDVFTIEEAKRVRQQQGLSTEHGKTVNMVSTWKKRFYVVQMADGSFKKNNNKFNLEK